MGQNSGAARNLKSLVLPALWLLTVLLLINFIHQVPTFAARRRVEFVGFLVSSKVIAAGRGASHFYDDDLFQKEIANLGYEVKEIFYPHPPTAALLFLPLARLDLQIARLAWVYLSLLFVALAVALQIKVLKLSIPWSLTVVSIVLLSQPLRADLRHGEIYSFTLLLTTLTWMAIRHRKQILAGIIFSVIIATKLFALPLYVFFLLRRHRKAILVNIISLLIILLVSLPLLTPTAWLEFVRIPLRFLEDTALLSVTAYQSLGSLIRHLFTFDPNWNPQPIMNQPALATALLWISQLLVVLLTLYAIWVSREPDLIFAAVVTLSLFLSPFAQDYTYTVLLLPIVILIARLRENASPHLILLAAIAILLYAANIPFKSPRLTVGFWALLAYPKLYAALIIWALLIGFALAGARGKAHIGDAAGAGELEALSTRSP